MTTPRVLIADDDSDLLALMARRCTRMGLQPDTAASGDQAATLLTSNAYDLLVTDINMPGMTGMDLLTLAKQRDPNMQVVIVTGGATLDTAIQAVNNGAFGYLTKPFDHLTILDNAVSKALEYRRLTLDNIRMGGIQKRRGDMLEEEASERLKQVNRQDREIRKILAHLPEGVVIIGGHRGVLPANPAAQAWLTHDARTSDRPIASYLDAVREGRSNGQRMVSLGGKTLQLSAVELGKSGDRTSRVVIIRDLSEEGRELGGEMAAPLHRLAQDLSHLLNRWAPGVDRDTLLRMARQVQALDNLRSALAGPPLEEPAGEESAPA